MTETVIRNRKRILFLVIVVLSAGFTGAGFPASVAPVGKEAGLPAGEVRSLAVDGGNVYVAVGLRGIAVYDASRGKAANLGGGAPLSGREVSSLAAFGGKLYVGTTDGLLSFDGRSWERIGNAENVTLRNVMLGASPDGKELWAAAMTLAGGTTKFDGSKWTFMGGGGRGLFNDISCFAFGKDGTWMGSATGTVYLHKGDDVQFFREGLSGIVLALAVAGDVVYAATNRGLFRLEGAAWKAVGFPEGWGGLQVLSMASDGKTLYLGTTAGLVRLAKDGAERLTRNDGLPADQVGAVALGDGAVYAGTAAGLAVVRGW